MTDNRLLTCAGLVTGGKAVDVGTDHGYLAVYLVEQGICNSVVACDVNEMPLESARKTAEKAGLTDKVTTILSDGLDNVPMEGVTDVVMAGMGGELIARLVGKCEQLKDKKINLVLQPMTKSEVLRKWLYEEGFEVRKELGCEDKGFVYSVMQVQFKGSQPEYPCDDRYLYGGLVSKDDDKGMEYLKHQSKRLQVAGEGMLKSADKQNEGERLLGIAELLLK